MNFSTCYKWKLYSYEYNISSNGSLWYAALNRIYSPEQYKITTDNAAWTCIPDELDTVFLKYGDSLACSVWILSQLCLLSSIIIYLTLRLDYLDCVPVVCHMISMFMNYLILTINQLLVIQSTTSCDILDFSSEIFFMGQNTWANIIIFEVCKQFYNLNRNKFYVFKQYTHKYSYQFLYAWGIPVVVFSAITVLGFSNLDFPPTYEFMIDGRCLTAIYRYAFVHTMFCFANAPFILLNTCLFAFAGFNLWTFKRNTYTTGMIKRRQSQLFWVSFKLLTISGIPWIADVAEWIAFSDTKQLQWRAVTEIFSGLQGTCLFLTYVMNTSVIKSLKSRVPSLTTSNHTLKFIQQASSQQVKLRESFKHGIDNSNTRFSLEKVKECKL